jgi:hypothetical protein
MGGPPHSTGRSVGVGVRVSVGVRVTVEVAVKEAVAVAVEGAGRFSAPQPIANDRSSTQPSNRAARLKLDVDLRCIVSIDRVWDIE